jgi:hypothetical protein
MTWDPFHRRIRALLRRRNATAAAAGRYATVTLHLDAMQLTRGLTRAARQIEELERYLTYRKRIEFELMLCRSTVNVLLDDLCRDFRFDPVHVWRIPHAADVLDRENEAAA